MLFAADLFRMYSRYAERKKWKIEIIEKQELEKAKQELENAKQSGSQ